MPDPTESFEGTDIAGSTVHYGSTVGTSATNVPTLSNKIISEVFIRNTGVIPTVYLLVSFDGGSGFVTLKTGESIIWSPKGRRKQLVIKSNTLTVPYEAIINYEDF